ncbi:hypothetical protein EYF80_048540 [Liparis tanakae]|uniref:Uncharacterized protein n=1 Tax=Liparis tanakae TaxID=230148 RepID=A0A4Z2FJY9_9TELE|nr:hypothetical protein EYF80_048540 [Liparis tanakae]
MVLSSRWISSRPETPFCPWPPPLPRVCAADSDGDDDDCGLLSCHRIQATVRIAMALARILRMGSGGEPGVVEVRAPHEVPQPARSGGCGSRRRSSFSLLREQPPLPERSASAPPPPLLLLRRRRWGGCAPESAAVLAPGCFVLLHTRTGAQVLLGREMKMRLMSQWRLNGTKHHLFFFSTSHSPGWVELQDTQTGKYTDQTPLQDMKSRWAEPNCCLLASNWKSFSICTLRLLCWFGVLGLVFSGGRGSEGNGAHLGRRKTPRPETWNADCPPTDEWSPLVFTHSAGFLLGDDALHLLVEDPLLLHLKAETGEHLGPRVVDGKVNKVNKVNAE